jgi:hypothetical protein
MKVKQFSNLFRCNLLVQILAVGSLAVGASMGIMVVPAQAVLLSGGQVVFTGATSSFSNLQDSVSGNLFDVTFNPSNSNASVSSASTPFSPKFFDKNIGGMTGAGAYGITASTGRFSYVSGTDAAYTYTLNSIGNNLDFAFDNGVTLTIAGGSSFTGSKFTSPTDASVSLDFIAQDPAGSYYTETGVKTILNALSFTVNDISSSTTGGYSILASTVTPTTKVHEPLTIIGTIVGGALILRMRKKLAQAS